MIQVISPAIGDAARILPSGYRLKCGFAAHERVESAKLVLARVEPLESCRYLDAQFRRVDCVTVSDHNVHAPTALIGEN